MQASISDPAPNIPHDQVMAEMREFLESKQTPSDAGWVAASSTN
ncbi:hypothetical protein ALQ07_04476 [Pseudomonas syringae pv. actinidiae]|uniref:Stability determinant domain-containing protein n=1 Tax=Pseudomonas syringae pv. actinidiae TaxID=103796 RepID=A0A3M4KG13_PSESF|nr:hypothetical protein ALQ07_04476 [Pseudomonas syringae pv. actinidiae]